MLANRREVVDLKDILQRQSVARRERVEREGDIRVPGQDGCAELGTAGDIDDATLFIATAEEPDIPALELRR